MLCSEFCKLKIWGLAHSYKLQPIGTSPEPFMFKRGRILLWATTLCFVLETHLQLESSLFNLHTVWSLSVPTSPTGYGWDGLVLLWFPCQGAGKTDTGMDLSGMPLRNAQWTARLQCTCSGYSQELCWDNPKTRGFVRTSGQDYSMRCAKLGVKSDNAGCTLTVGLANMKRIIRGKHWSYSIKECV